MSAIQLSHSLLQTILPGTPGWCGELVGELLPVLVIQTNKATEQPGLPESDQRAWVVGRVRFAVDEAFTEGGWADIDDAVRDQFIEDLTGVVFFLRDVNGRQSPRALAHRVDRGPPPPET